MVSTGQKPFSSGQTVQGSNPHEENVGFIRLEASLLHRRMMEDRKEIRTLHPLHGVHSTMKLVLLLLRFLWVYFRVSTGVYRTIYRSCDDVLVGGYNQVAASKKHRRSIQQNQRVLFPEKTIAQVSS